MFGIVGYSKDSQTATIPSGGESLTENGNLSMPEGHDNVLLLLLETQNRQLEAIKEKLVDIELRLSALEESAKLSTSRWQMITKILTTWQFWGILLAMYVSIDFKHFFQILKTIVDGGAA